MDTPRIDTTSSPAVWYARVLGITLTIAGVIGLIDNTSQDSATSLFGLDVNLFHNFVHLATGALGLIAGYVVLTTARAYAWTFGLVYIVVAVWALFDSDPLGLFVNINGADTVLHFALGVLGLGAAAVSTPEVYGSHGRVPRA